MNIFLNNNILIEVNIEKEVYNPKDVERIKADSKWLRAFYKHSLDDSDKTVEMINDVLKWRQDFDCNSKFKKKNFN